MKIGVEGGRRNEKVVKLGRRHKLDKESTRHNLLHTHTRSLNMFFTQVVTKYIYYKYCT